MGKHSKPSKDSLRTARAAWRAAVKLGEDTQHLQALARTTIRTGQQITNLTASPLWEAIRDLFNL